MDILNFEQALVELAKGEIIQIEDKPDHYYRIEGSNPNLVIVGKGGNVHVRKIKDHIVKVDEKGTATVGYVFSKEERTKNFKIWM